MEDIDSVFQVPPGHRSGFVAVMGKPNVGKSTLVNAYVGQKIAIISEKPQTTRHRLLGILTLPEAQIIFVDTPGIHTPQHKLGEYMVATATGAVPDSDLAIFMVDISSQPTSEDRQIVELLGRYPQIPVILAMNKLDLVTPEEAERTAEDYLSLRGFAEAVMLSATRGDNRTQLLEHILAHLPEGPRYYPPDQITDQPERVIAAELVREQVLRFTFQEVPYSVAVMVEEFRERRADLIYIEATIYVEKDSQKGIIIGQGGRMLKRIGQAARGELENLLGHKVYLDLWVKVRRKWRRDDRSLEELGYTFQREI